TFIFNLHCKRTATTAGAACIRVFEYKTTCIEPVFIVYFHAVEVNAMRLLHNYIDATNFILLIIFLFFVEPEYIAETGTATTLYAHAKKLFFVEIRLLHQSFNFDNSGFCKGYRTFLYCFHLYVSILRKVIVGIRSIQIRKVKVQIIAMNNRAKLLMLYVSEHFL